MGIEWYRDLFIIILCFVISGFFTFLAVICFNLYRRAKNLQSHAKETLAMVETIASIFNDIIKPLLPLIAVVKGASQGIKAVNEIIEKFKGGNHGQ